MTTGKITPGSTNCLTVCNMLLSCWNITGPKLLLSRLERALKSYTWLSIIRKRLAGQSLKDSNDAFHVTGQLSLFLWKALNR